MSMFYLYVSKTQDDDRRRLSTVVEAQTLQDALHVRARTLQLRPGDVVHVSPHDQEATFVFHVMMEQGLIWFDQQDFATGGVRVDGYSLAQTSWLQIALTR